MKMKIPHPIIAIWTAILQAPQVDTRLGLTREIQASKLLFTADDQDEFRVWLHHQNTPLGNYVRTQAYCQSTGHPGPAQAHYGPGDNSEYAEVFHQVESYEFPDDGQQNRKALWLLSSETCWTSAQYLAGHTGRHLLICNGRSLDGYKGLLADLYFWSLADVHRADIVFNIGSLHIYEDEASEVYNLIKG